VVYVCVCEEAESLDDVCVCGVCVCV